MRGRLIARLLLRLVWWDGLLLNSLGLDQSLAELEEHIYQTKLSRRCWFLDGYEFLDANNHARKQIIKDDLGCDTDDADDSNADVNSTLHMSDKLQDHSPHFNSCNHPCCCVFKLLNSLSHAQSRRKVNLPPGPPKLPIIGNLHQLSNQPHLSLQHLSNKFGPIFHLKLGEIPTVVISSAKIAKEAFKNHDISLSSRPLLFPAKYLIYNCTDISFSPYGPYWRHVRKICILELLNTKRVQSFSFVREEEVAKLVRRIAEGYPDTINLSKKLMAFANDIIRRTAFGRCFTEELGEDDDDDEEEFHAMLAESQVLLGEFSLGDYFPSMEWIHTLTGRKARLVRLFRRFDRFFDRMIEEHMNSTRVVRVDHRDLIDVLLDIQQNGSLDMPLTMDNIKAIIMDMFGAGTDTTFVALDWGMTELLLNPKVMQKAQMEVRSVVGERRRVVESDLTQLDYLTCVIKEILRLHPPAPLSLPRESMDDVTVDGYIIPAKTRFFTNVWAIARDPDTWESPETFKPERFINSSIDFRGQDFEFIPFGAGRRMCPAITFGTATIELALAQLLHSFDWELPPGVTAENLDLSQEFGLTMRRSSDLIVIAKPRFP
ncbi:hypothetical protein Syun_020387 [Stephania yunnanensis]|uniref:Cytochrome P450 n=1 Tax=Stephania yunnanensis TaxID=152371 RepID=A0AAP0NPY8_9MAGN